MSAKDMTNFSNDTLTVLFRVENDRYGSARWKCRCFCGKEFVALGSYIRSGKTRSCGCLQRIVASELNKTHGESKTSLYKLWAGIKKRCYNPNNIEYNRYGGRGISLCDEWHDFSVFKSWAERNGYQKGLTIDRIDNDVGYNPSNCRWVTRDIQNRNTSRTHRIDCGNNRFLTAAEVGRIVDVDRCTIARWCREYSATTIEEIETICEKRIHRKRKTNWALLGKKEDIPSW